MTNAASPPTLANPLDAWRRFRNRLVSSPKFQSFAQKTPGARTLARKDGEKLFDLIAGFTYTQTLYALTETGLIGAMKDGAQPLDALAFAADLPTDRAEVLLKGGEALGLVERWRGGYGLTRLGAAFAGAPGLTDLVLHHRELYLDLADPKDVLAGEGETRLAAYWPYVFGADAAQDNATAQTYSELMTRSQAMVAEDTLAALSLFDVRHLMDVGGGVGTFLIAAGQRWPDLRLTLFDLPAVAEAAQGRFAAAGLAGRAAVRLGSFREALPDTGADAISLIRVLYDHEDDTVRALLTRAYEALPPGGRLIVSEPMGGGDAPHRYGDVYFALYCLAMRTGRVRSVDQISAMMEDAGFTRIRAPRTRRAFVTSVVTGLKV